MKQTINGGALPTANIVINKSRLKLYNKESKIPTYYLEKGAEFQIELFNPTTGNVLAKIKLNNNSISQGGLVLRPGERVFLDRYIDVAKKFLFETYEVGNTSEVKEAIKENGDFSVEFFNQIIKSPYTYNPGPFGGYYGRLGGSFGSYNGTGGYNPSSGGYVCDSLSNQVIGLTTLTSNSTYSATNSLNLSNVTNCVGTDNTFTTATYNSQPVKKSKKIETGIVAEGSNSKQELTEVNYDFTYSPFHTIEYKLLPQSQKITTSDDLKIKRYCHSCGCKQTPTNKFCPSCGKKQ